MSQTAKIRVEDKYPIAKIHYPDHDGVVTVILDHHLKDYTPPVKWEDLCHELAGQTRALEGVYPGDVERWLNKQPVID